MQGVEPHERRAALTPLLEHDAQVGEVSHPPVAPGAQRIELRGGAEDAPAILHCGGQIAGLGCYRQHCLPQGRLAGAQCEAVVARRRVEVERQPARYAHPAVDLRALELLQRARLAHAFVLEAVLLVQAPAQRLRIQRHGQAQGEPQLVRDPHDLHGRNAFGPDPRAVGGQRAAHLLVGCRGHVHGPEQRAQRLVRHVVPPAPDIVPGGIDAVRLCEMAERFYISHAIPRFGV